VKAGLLLAVALAVAAGAAQAEGGLDGLAAEVFTAITEAEEAGGDVSELVEGLDRALALMRSGDPADEYAAEGLLNDLLVEAEAVRAAGARRETYEAAVAVAKTVVLLGAAAAVWLRGDGWFWRLWRRSKAGYVAE